MCVSAEFCEQHLMLLFKVLETSKDPAIRSNIVIALGDIAVCFATIMDQNSDRLYAGLTDHDLTVKKNTLMVLTHLILNGMIKVKGQLGEMAKCLEDEEERISDLARLFFTELSTKDNAIYNNLYVPRPSCVLRVLTTSTPQSGHHLPPLCRQTCCQRGIFPLYHGLHIHLPGEGSSEAVGRREDFRDP